MSRTIEVADMSLELAQALIEGALAESAAIAVPMAVAVVDRGGNLVAAGRADHAPVVAMPLAIDKAWTALSCQAPSDAWAQTTGPGGEDWGMSLALGGRLLVLPGGLPVELDGQTVGAVGVSGGAGDEDRRCAQAGVVAAT